MKVELIGFYKATTLTLLLGNFIKALNVVDTIGKPLKIYCDSSIVLFFSKNNKSRSRSKNITIKYLVIRDHKMKNKVINEYIKKDFVIADHVTKGLSDKVHE